MKHKLHYFAMLLLVAAAPAFGQVSIGAKAGASLNFFGLKSDYLKDNFDSKPGIGYLGGIAIDIPLVAGLSIQPEVYFSQKSGKLNASEFNYFSSGSVTFSPGQVFWFDLNGNDFPDDDVSGDGVADVYAFPTGLYEDKKVKLNYLEIPLLVKYEFLGGGYGFYLEAGPNFAIGLGAKENVALTDGKGSEEFGGPVGLTSGTLTKNYMRWYRDFVQNPSALETQVSFGKEAGDFYKGLDFGLTLGGGIYFELDAGKIYLDLRFVKGMSQLYNENSLAFKSTSLGGKGLYYEDFQSKTNSLQLSVSYMIPLSGGF